jgi:hypothetical protein
MIQEQYFCLFPQNAVRLCTNFRNVIHFILRTKKTIVMVLGIKYARSKNLCGGRINEVKISRDQNLWGLDGCSPKWALLGKFSNSLPDLVMLVIWL